MKRRGMTMLEVMFTMAVLTTGMMGTMMIVSETVKYNRRSNNTSQAQAIADRVLEEISSRGCQPITPGGAVCGNIQALDQTSRTFYWGPDMRLAENVGTDYQGMPLVNEAPPPEAKQYTAWIDVDPPFEGGESYSGATEFGAGQVVNIRVTVTWTDTAGVLQAVALQNRVRP